jgi:PAS domain S-box-containing protein
MTTPATILIVEDNPASLRMLRAILESEGYIVVEAVDGATALAAAERQLPDLVVQDLNLPDMDGFELLQRLRSVVGGVELPILALSGYLGRLDETRAGEAGFSALLVKPIQRTHALESIRACLPQMGGASSGDGTGRHLLVVDDDAVQLKLTRIHFTQLGFAVTTASGGSDALATARALRPDVVMTDVFMPDIDGFQLCLELRRDPELSRLPVVLVSAQYNSDADSDLARRVGANALVRRTPDFDECLPAIIEALRHGPMEPTEEPTDALQLKHARMVIQQLERQATTMAGLAQRSALQGAQLSLLSGVTDALTQNTDVDAAVRDVLASTLDAAGISKGALMLRDAGGVLQLRQCVGFSEADRTRLQDFFGHLPLLERIVQNGTSVSIPSRLIPEAPSAEILAAARLAAVHIVPLMSEGQSVGALIIGVARTDVTSDDSIAFARAVGHQIVQSLELTRSVARLSDSEARYRNLLDSAQDAIAVLTPDGVIRELNHRWVEILGRPKEQIVGHHIREFAPLGAQHDNSRVLAEAASSGTIRTPPVEIAKHDGSIVLLEFSTTTIDVGDGRLLMTIGRDVTEQQLLEQQLRQSQKLEAVGQLAGGVAHDFNNVLTAILGFCELLMEELDPGGRQHADVVQIQKAGERAASLTRQLLAFSRKQILQPAVLDPNALIRNLEPMLQRLIVETIDVSASLKRDIGRVRMDPTQLEQILINLAVNAGDAMPNGGKLTIETTEATLDRHYQQSHVPVVPGDYVAVIVSDTGDGMDEATKRHIFEPFFTTKGVGKGTGLGLSTVYGIVKQSGGYVWVYSELGLGTTFKIYLPRIAGPLEGSSEAAPTSHEPSVGVETVLLVEDDEAVRRLTREVLQRSGYRVLEAGNPREAFQVASDCGEPIDLLLTDVVMPESEGLPLFDRLSKTRNGLRVLYMSGYADEAVVRHGVLAAGFPFLQKPFTPQVLARKVRAVLDAPQ